MQCMAHAWNFILPRRLPTPIQSLAKQNRKPMQVVENKRRRPKSIASFCRVFCGYKVAASRSRFAGRPLEIRRQQRQQRQLRPAETGRYRVNYQFNSARKNSPRFAIRQLPFASYDLCVAVPCTAPLALFARWL